MSPSGEEITLPVQWCEVKDPFEVPNSVPTCGVPENATPVSGSDTRIELVAAVVVAATAEDAAVVDDVAVVEAAEALGLAEAFAEAVAEALALLVAVGVGVCDVPELTSLSRPLIFAYVVAPTPPVSSSAAHPTVAMRLYDLRACGMPATYECSDKRM